MLGMKILPVVSPLQAVFSSLTREVFDKHIEFNDSCGSENMTYGFIMDILPQFYKQYIINLADAFIYSDRHFFEKAGVRQSSEQLG